MSRCDLAAVWLEADREMIASERLGLDVAGRLRAGDNAYCFSDFDRRILSLRLLNPPPPFSLLPRRHMLLSIESMHCIRLARALM